MSVAVYKSLQTFDATTDDEVEIEKIASLWWDKQEQEKHWWLKPLQKC
jgi:hypothetical protein